MFMGFLLKVLGVSLVVAGINRINHNIEELVNKLIPINIFF